MHRTHSRGFTLVEILVALSIFLVMATFLLSISGQAANIWRRQNDLSSIRERARAALDVIGSELQQAVMPLDVSLNNSVQLVVNPPDVATTYQSRDAIFWYAPIASLSGSGNLAAVGYFTRKTGGLYQLCRFYAPSGDANFLLYSSPESWVTTTLLDNAAPASEASKFKGLFLENVGGFWVNAYDTDGSLLPDTDTRVTRKLPARLEISIVFFDSLGATKAEGGVVLPSPSASTDAAAYLAALPESLRSNAGAVSISVSFRNRKQ